MNTADSITELFLNSGLLFLSRVYHAIWALRRWLFDTGVLRIKRLPCKVICVGNITVGGTGKTPAVIEIASLLRDNGRRVAIVSRGYKRKGSSPVVIVSDGNTILCTPEESGDEPYLMAMSLKSVPVIVSKDRYSGGKYAIDNFDTEYVLLDDGYQHFRLHRDIDILLVNARNPFGNGYLLPYGILREPVHGISRAHCIVITKSDNRDTEYIEEVIREYNSDSPIFRSVCRYTSLTDIDGGTLPADYLMGKRVVLLSGIADPASFRKTVEGTGASVIEELIYGDHFWYTARDIVDIAEKVYGIGIDGIVTTAKDAVRLRQAISKVHSVSKDDVDVRFLLDRLCVLNIRMDLDIEGGLKDWILEKTKEKEAQQTPAEAH